MRVLHIRALKQCDSPQEPCERYCGNSLATYMKTTLLRSYRSSFICFVFNLILFESLHSDLNRDSHDSRDTYRSKWNMTKKETTA